MKLEAASAPPLDGDPHGFADLEGLLGLQSNAASQEGEQPQQRASVAVTTPRKHNSRRRFSAHRAAFLAYLALASGAVLGLGIYNQVQSGDALVNRLAWNGLYRAFLGQGVVYVVLGSLTLLLAIVSALVPRQYAWRILYRTVSLLCAVLLALLAALCIVYAAGDESAELAAWRDTRPELRCLFQHIYQCSGFYRASDGTAPPLCGPVGRNVPGCQYAFIRPSLNPYLAVQGMACLSVATLLFLESIAVMICF
jgi:hypothetical protein